MGIRRWACVAFGIAIAASIVSGCGGSDDKKSASGLEKTELKVGTLPIVDDSPFFLALKNGYFKAEGLKVTPTTLANGEEGITRLQSGGIDLAWSSYPNAIMAVDSGKVQLRIVVDGYTATKHLFSVLALPKSKIKKPADLVNKKVSVNGLKGLGPLLLSSALKTAGVDPKSVKMVAVPFPQMPAQLQAGAIDAAWITEPFVTQASQRLGATEIIDTATGPADGLPIAGFVSTAAGAKKYPKTFAAFQRAMAKAQALAANRSQVEQILPTYIKTITPQVASTITIGTFPTSLNKARLQRVPDLMQEFGLISNHLDMQTMLVPQS
ncbi:ABC transporter substrate-binding protein [Actinoallomurus vinaceus]|uniref:ABC transporter substrate-binding protein n=1 Tax=Actinoallomurus vinaceus TaxID=1080074 RepID=A0ABP8UCQ7_9ACTN